MTNSEIFKRLDAFASYLDSLPPSFEKGRLSYFFIGFLECFNKIIFLEKGVYNERNKESSKLD